MKPVTPHRKAQSQAVAVSEVPKWVLPVIRHVCRALGAPAAPHHVFAGVSSILTLPAPRSEDPKVSSEEPRDINISALIIVVFLLVITRLTGNEMPAAEFTRLRGLAIASIGECGISEAVGEVADTENVVARVGTWMRDIGAKGWTELDWFANVGEGSGLGIAELEPGEDGEDDVDDDEPVYRGASPIVGRLDLSLNDEDVNVLRPGLGTMVSPRHFFVGSSSDQAFRCIWLSSSDDKQMQDRVDYLSEHRVREYQTWKKDILLQCEEIENLRQMDEAAN